MNSMNPRVAQIGDGYVDAAGGGVEPQAHPGGFQVGAGVVARLRQEVTSPEM